MEAETLRQLDVIQLLVEKEVLEELLKSHFSHPQRTFWREELTRIEADSKRLQPPQP